LRAPKAKVAGGGQEPARNAGAVREVGSWCKREDEERKERDPAPGAAAFRRSDARDTNDSD
jgi:hypothetical protein